MPGRAAGEGVAVPAEPGRGLVDVGQQDHAGVVLARQVSQAAHERSDQSTVVLVAVIGIAGVVDHDQPTTRGVRPNLLQHRGENQPAQAHVVELVGHDAIASGAIHCAQTPPDLRGIQSVGLEDVPQPVAHQLARILQAHEQGVTILEAMAAPAHGSAGDVGAQRQGEDRLASASVATEQSHHAPRHEAIDYERRRREGSRLDPLEVDRKQPLQGCIRLLFDIHRGSASASGRPRRT